jgi:predicted DNA-binding ArsR family transcriptional regulator
MSPEKKKNFHTVQVQNSTCFVVTNEDVSQIYYSPEKVYENVREKERSLYRSILKTYFNERDISSNDTHNPQ